MLSEKKIFFTCRYGHGIAPPTGIANFTGTIQVSPLLKSTSTQVELIFFITVPKKQHNKILKWFLFYPLWNFFSFLNPIGCHTSLKSNVSVTYILHFYLARASCARAIQKFAPKNPTVLVTVLNNAIKIKWRTIFKPSSKICTLITWMIVGIMKLLPQLKICNLKKPKQVKVTQTHTHTRFFFMKQKNTILTY